MKLVSVRLITADVPRLVSFYEMVAKASAVWGNALFAEIPTSVGTLAIGSDKTVPLFGAGPRNPRPTAARSSSSSFADVDAEFDRLRKQLDDVVTEPTTMPWGNRALLLRDPDGNLVNLFTTRVRPGAPPSSASENASARCQPHDRNLATTLAVRSR